MLKHIALAVLILVPSLGGGFAASAAGSSVKTWGPTATPPEAGAAQYTREKPREWKNLNANPLRKPNDPAQIRRVMEGFTMPSAAREALIAEIIAGRAHAGQVCRGDLLAGISFGDAEVWDYPTTVVWSNRKGRCDAALVYQPDAIIDGHVWRAVRIATCKNIAPLFPVKQAPPAVPGFIPGMTPQGDCPDGRCDSCQTE